MARSVPLKYLIKLADAAQPFATRAIQQVAQTLNPVVDAINAVLPLENLPAHHSTHEIGGTDPITGLAPGAHATTHASGGSDPVVGVLALAGLSVDGTTLAVDAANNRVGIGTAAPSSDLEINRNNSVLANPPRLTLTNVNAGGYTSVAWASDNGYATNNLYSSAFSDVGTPNAAGWYIWLTSDPLNGMAFEVNKAGNAGLYSFRVGGTQRLGISSSGVTVAGVVESTATGFKFPDATTQATAAPTAFGTTAGTICQGNDARLLHYVGVPATATSAGNAGDYAADASWLYICEATNTWRRVAVAAW